MGFVIGELITFGTYNKIASMLTKNTFLCKIKHGHFDSLTWVMIVTYRRPRDKGFKSCQIDGYKMDIFSHLFDVKIKDVWLKRQKMNV